ncbi:MAG TPA: EAL domain-containing response regulator [Stellaceae bacterium]|nr:EAL domain-containing response regulator [Stellaceae bacterium]
MTGNLLSNRLLVVDDDAALGRLIKNSAESAGFEVSVTKDPEAFAEKSRVWQPTVLMLDLAMSGTDGIQILRGLAADGCSGHVILMSGADSKVLESATRLGRARGLKISGILEKPMRVEALRKLLAQFQVAKTLLTADLAGAIATNQLFLDYQLKLDCRAARMTGVEALVRWRHPTLGIIPPDQFIPLAEETELIHKLTDWVIVAAAKQMAAWHLHNPALEMAINISAKDVQDLTLPDRLHKHCRAAGIDCASITLELTETGAMREALQMMDVLTRLRLKGFRLSIDDFGTGFSSLVQLQNMPFSEVKIDRSFVMQMMDNNGCKAIVEIVIDLARKLGLHSVAEGVEDEATLHSLMNLGCDVAQGYHLSRPVGAERIPAFITDYQLMRGVYKAPKPPLPSPFTNVRAWRRRKAVSRQLEVPMIAALAPAEPL